ncbi:MAG: hypothetical protein H7246_07700 [Phycisphaerae bacterium]|nr:hypothetical protein [Saprospiraceae bacterium]
MQAQAISNIPVLRFLDHFRHTANAFWAVLTVFAFACSGRHTEQPVPLDLDHFAYFPLQIGKYIEYKVDSVVYDFASGGATIQDSSQTFVKEIVADTLRGNLGELQYVIERYERADAGALWAFKSASIANKSVTEAIRTEGNWRFLKLVFPLDRRSAWDGNLWIDENREIEIAGERMRPFTNWAYEVDSIDVQALVGQFSFDSTLLVTEADDSNVIERRLSRVRYAKHIGVVWREQWILDSQYCNQVPPPADCETRPWEQKAEKGYILRQTIISFN